MRVLLDTHVLLWWIVDDARLSDAAREILRDGRDELYFSAASGWEIAIKAGLGRLDLPRPAAQFIPDQMARNRIQGLPVQLSHALGVASLPPHHRDPFDRLLVSQALCEDLPILTADSVLRQYDAEVLW